MTPGIAVAGTRPGVCRTDILDSREKLSRDERLCDAGSGSVPASDRRHFELLKARDDNDRWSGFARGDRFQNRHAMDAGIDINNDEIDLSQAVPEQFEGVLRIGGLQQEQTRTRRSLRNDRIRVARFFRYQQRVCFHAGSRAADASGRSTAFVICRAKIAAAANGGIQKRLRIFSEPSDRACFTALFLSKLRERFP